jgi:xylulokinase
MLDASHLSRRQMPRLVEGSAPAGRLRADVASSWGVPAVSVAGGGGDNAAGAVGVGAVQAGDALLSLGTSGVIFVVNDRFRPNPAGGVHAFCHCLPGLWHQMSVHLSAASCLDWAARLVGAPDVAGVLSLAEATGASAGPELFLPYLGGERTPHNDADIRGAFLRLDHDTDRGRLAQAVFEGVAFALADGLSALRDAGTHISRLSVIGGGARSRTWCELIAAALDLPLDLLQGGETGPALGAARLAQLAVAGGSAEAVCTRPPLSASIMPDARTTARLAPKLAAFRRAYPALSALKDHASD